MREINKGVSPGNQDGFTAGIDKSQEAVRVSGAVPDEESTGPNT